MNNKKIIIIVSSLLIVIIGFLLFLSINKDNDKSYNILFDTKGGTLIEMQVVKEGNKVIKPNNPEKDGYKFVEWTYLGVVYDFNSEVLSNMTLEANYVELEDDKVTYVVKFNTDGGTTVSNQIVFDGYLVSKPIDPVKEGYIFKGWFLDDKEYDFTMQINDNIELVAKWEKEVDKSSKPSSSSSSNKPLSSSSSSKPSSSSSSMASSSSSEKKKYIVTFDSNGGSSVSSQTIIEGNKASKPNNPTRSGYSFVDWMLNGNSYDFNDIVDKNITLIAKWNKNNYKIVVNVVDDYSPARILTVYENERKISVSEIRYSDGTYLCSGANPNVNKNALVGETTFIVVLSDGTQVNAMIG